MSFSKGKPGESHFDFRTRDKFVPLRRIDYFQDIEDPVKVQIDPEKPPSKEDIENYER